MQKGLACCAIRIPLPNKIGESPAEFTMDAVKPLAAFLGILIFFTIVNIWMALAYGLAVIWLVGWVVAAFRADDKEFARQRARELAEANFQQAGDEAYQQEEEQEPVTLHHPPNPVRQQPTINQARRQHYIPASAYQNNRAH
jgi:hypothetical protein